MRITLGQLRKIIREAITHSENIEEIRDWDKNPRMPEPGEKPTELSPDDQRAQARSDKSEAYLQSIKSLGETELINKLKKDTNPAIQITTTSKFKGDAIKAVADTISSFNREPKPLVEFIYQALLMQGITVSVINDDLIK
jgi:hypothetical protein